MAFSIILARILTPSDFGTVAIVMVLYILTQEIIRFGLDTAIIQKQIVSNEEYSVAFFVIFSLSIVFSVLLFLAAPVIAKFYNNTELINVSKLFSVLYIIDGLMHVQKIKLKKKLDFKRLNFYLIVSKLIAGSSAVYLALSGFGLLSLVYQNLIIAALQMILICYAIKWRPQLTWKLSSISTLVNYSKYIFSSNLIYHISQRLDSLIIAKYFDTTLLGLYDKGKNLSELSQRLPSNFIMKPLFTSLSSLQDNKPELQRMMNRIYTSISFVFIPFLLYLIFNAEALLNFVYGVQWTDSAPYFSLFSVMAIFYLLRVPTNYLLLAKGMSKEVFRIDLVINVTKIIVIITLATINIYWMIVILIVIRAIEAGVYFYFCDKVLYFPFRDYIGIIIPYFSIGLVVITLIHFIMNKLIIIESPFIYVLVSSLLFSSVYLMINYALRMDGLKFHWDLTKQYILKSNSSA